MSNRKFKIGDRVRIIKVHTIELYELNKIGTIVKTRDWLGQEEWITYIVDMGRPRREREPACTCWYLKASMIELVRKKNEQLLFNFMYE